MIKVHPYSFFTSNIIKEKVKVSLVLDCRVLLLAACIRVVEMSMPFKLECLYILVSHFEKKRLIFNHAKFELPMGKSKGGKRKL